MKSAPTDLKKIIPLGVVAYSHGLSKEGIQKWAVKLYSRCGELIQKHSSNLFVSPADGAWIDFSPSNPIEAKGAKISECEELLVGFSSQENPKGFQIGILRENFPLLGVGEFYLCDLLNCKLLSNPSQSLGIVVGVEEVHAPGNSSKFLLKIQGENNFSLPFEWVDLRSEEGRRYLQEKQCLWAPGAEVWIKI